MDEKEELRKRMEADNAERALSAASKLGLAGAIGYFVVIYMAGIHGILREYALIFAGGVGWLCWRLVLSSFDK